MKPLQRFLIGLLLLCGISTAWPQEPAVQSSNLYAPFASYQEAEQALRTGTILKVKDLGSGTTHPMKVYLQRNNVEFKAVFKTIDQHYHGITRMQKNSEVDFKDSWMYEIAAYELDKLLGLNMVPPTVQRIYKGQKGSLQLWIEDAMTEKQRKEMHLQPPDVDQWNRQILQLRLFDNLIYNIDRNLGNLLITSDWKIHMIDHSRSFKTLDILKAPNDLQLFSKSTMESLQNIDLLKLKACCSHYLTGPEMNTLLKRRDIILEQYQTLLAEKGPAIYFPWN
ncbi:MAG TPA: hypothetical protein VH815_08140 [Acidobacteriota bacterium]